MSLVSGNFRPYWQYVVLGVFLIAVLVGGFFFWIEDETRQLEVVQSEVAYYMDDVVTVQTDDDGKRLYEMRTPKVVHYYDNHSEVEKPEIVVYQNSQPAWLVWADTGIVYHEFSVVLLQNNVKARSLKPDEEEIFLTTQKLRFLIKSGVAETDESVVLTQGAHILKSFGLKFFLYDDRLNLMKNVKSFYVL